MSLAALAAIASPATAKEGFFVVGWSHGRIEQGMSRESVEAILSQQGINFSDDPTFGPSFDTGDRKYHIGFCNGELAYASWLLSDNTQILRSMAQRVNVEGFRVQSTSVDYGYNDRINSENLGLNIFLSHPSNNKAYRVTYHIYPINGQIQLRDTRYGHSCQPDAEDVRESN